MVSSVFVAALLASAAVAGPIAPRARHHHHGVSFKKTVNKAHLSNLVFRDTARARNILNRHKKNRRQEDVQVDNTAVSYLAAVQVGNPPTTYNLIIDTGSSNTWVGAGTPYQQTQTSTAENSAVSVSYGSGSFSGQEFTDQVALSNDLVFTQSIGVADQATGFNGVDGILGFGPTDLTAQTVQGVNTVPTVMDTMATNGLIQQELVGISFEPATSANDLNGVLTYGGVDNSKFTGNITFVPITSTAPASQFWGVDAQFEMGGQTILNSSGIVDTGTTLILLASDAFQQYAQATGATLNNQTGLLEITQNQLASLPDLNFNMGGTTFALSANAQVFPRSLNAQIGGADGQIFLVVSDLGSNSGQGLDFIAGQSFLERFYSVYDTTNAQVGLATTPFTNATTN